MQKFLCFVCLVSLVLSTFAQSQPKSLEASVDAYLQPFVKANHFSGVVLLTQQGKVVYEKAFGFAQAEHNVANRPDTRFCIASVNKSMTRGLAILLLQQRKLGLQDKLSKWIPDFPNGDQITVEQLLRHRAGIPHRVTQTADEVTRQTPATMVELAKRAPLAFTPGERSLYSSGGYSVLARVLELAGGKPFAQLLQESIFAPAGLTDTVDYNGEIMLPRRAQEYFLEDGGIIPAPLKNYSFLVGAGSLYSTARDVLRFGEAVLDGKYGEGVKLSLSSNGVYSDNGSTNGFRCNVKVDRQKSYAMVLMANLNSGATDLLIRDLPNLLEGKTVESPTIPTFTAATIESKVLPDYVGWYRGQNEFAVHIVNDALYAGDYKLTPSGKDRFYYLGNYAEITFRRGEDGKVKELEWSASWGKGIWTRHPLPPSNK